MTVVDAEITALLHFLQVQRNHVLGALDGLDDEALRRAVLPSGWNCLGMVQHLTRVERFWFQAVVAGDKDVIAWLDGAGSSWQVEAGTAAAEVLDRYRAETSRADSVITTSAADDALAWWPPSTDPTHGEQYRHTVRDVLLHVITETACHAGHLDAVRELIDGKQWFVNT
ncbi:DinB family protein [Streptomyces sp. NPDC056653]|uniref:DinB family protein n=1 Tax=Streptomyces sp. NPDC056653 TaxID=3345894 RepID=UPI00369BBED7